MFPRALVQFVRFICSFPVMLAVKFSVKLNSQKSVPFTSAVLFVIETDETLTSCFIVTLFTVLFVSAGRDVKFEPETVELTATLIIVDALVVALKNTFILGPALRVMPPLPKETFSVLAEVVAE